MCAASVANFAVVRLLLDRGANACFEIGKMGMKNTGWECLVPDIVPILILFFTCVGKTMWN